MDDLLGLTDNEAELLAAACNLALYALGGRRRFAAIAATFRYTLSTLSRRSSCPSKTGSLSKASAASEPPEGM